MYHSSSVRFEGLRGGPKMKPEFLNRASDCPWVSRAPKTYKPRRARKPRNDENNNCITVTINPYVTPQNQLYTCGFSAHSGYYQTFYFKAKRALQEDYERRVRSAPNQSQFNRISPPIRVCPHLQQQNGSFVEVIDLTNDPLSIDHDSRLTTPSRSHETHKSKPKKNVQNARSNVVDDRTNLPILRNAMTSVANPKKKGDDHPAVGVVLTKKKDRYVVRLL